MKELVKPSLTEEEYEEKDAAGYCDLACPRLVNCGQNDSDDDSGDILF